MQQGIFVSRDILKWVLKVKVILHKV